MINTSFNTHQRLSFGLWDRGNTTKKVLEEAVEDRRTNLGNLASTIETVLYDPDVTVSLEKEVGSRGAHFFHYNVKGNGEGDQEKSITATGNQFSTFADNPPSTYLYSLSEPEILEKRKNAIKGRIKTIFSQQEIK